MDDVTTILNGGTRVQIEGLNRTVRQLSKAGADAQDMKNLMHEIGMIVVNAANPPVRSGALSGSLRAGRGKTKAVVRAGGARIPYAGVVHYGWPARGIRPNPFLIEALAARQAVVFQRLDRGLDDLLKKADLK